ncbi:hypothetical protein ES703_44500 [subsurface metagenome]
MAENRRISPVIILAAGAGIAVAAAVGIYALARAAPPEAYTCPVCGDKFSTLEALRDHFETEHPHEPIDIIWE